ncbi:MGMT family protein [Thaumasiovibrio sp. DFM-14]|uniref:MGMT family protein n=1 Tax=Thaumasiovibrio sp. DFM-14 TaxID=3384792 RepID=UPI00399F9185
MTDFKLQIYAVLHQIPHGYVTTYGDVAKRAGYPGYARQVGKLLSDLPKETTLPWFRVINGKGEISLKGDNAARQIEALRNDGVDVAQGKVSLRKYRWLG